MSRLTELLSKSITVIVRYHQIESGNESSLEAETVTRLLTLPHEELREELLKLIMAATQPVETRRPLLMYIYHGIELLKTLNDSNATFFQAQVKEISSELLTLFMTLKTLLTTSQQKLAPLKYEDISTETYGLVNGVWPMNGLCTSGRIIDSTLFPALRLRHTEADAERIQLALDDILREHVLSLKLKETQEALEHARRLIPSKQRVQLGPIVTEPRPTQMASHIPSTTHFPLGMEPQEPRKPSFFRGLFPRQRQDDHRPGESGSFLDVMKKA